VPAIPVQDHYGGVHSGQRKRQNWGEWGALE
jgi:hypothetical protein